MVESSCARNRHLPQLLTAPKLTGWVQDKGEGATDNTALELFPTLFCVARQAPRTALNNILIGLLATMASDDVCVFRGIRRTMPQQDGFALFEKRR
jgi:hypothetical protein